MTIDEISRDLFGDVISVSVLTFNAGTYDRQKIQKWRDGGWIAGLASNDNEQNIVAQLA